MEWYTKKEVSDILGISKATVYHWAKEKKIIKIEDPFRTHREVRYQKAEVDEIAKERELFPNGFTPAAVAKRLDVSLQSIYKYIQDGLIQAIEVPKGDERKSYIISPEAFQEAEKLLKPTEAARPKRGEYYESKLDIGLFQKFYSSKLSEARVSRNENKDWGFIIQSNQKWITYEEGINEYQLVPSYGIHNELIDYNGYVTFEIPLDTVLFYPLMDYLYQVWGVENIRLRDQKNGFIRLLVRAGEKPLITHAFSVSDLLPFVKEGQVYQDSDLLVLISDYRKTTFELPKKLLSEMSTAAEQEGMNTNLWLQKLIEKALRPSHSSLQ